MKTAHRYCADRDKGVRPLIPASLSYEGTRTSSRGNISFMSSIVDVVGCAAAGAGDRRGLAAGREARRAVARFTVRRAALRDPAFFRAVLRPRLILRDPARDIDFARDFVFVRDFVFDRVFALVRRFFAMRAP
jgi:hypothetical protein